MKNGVKKFFIPLAAAIFTGCAVNTAKVQKFDRVFSWGAPGNETSAACYAQAGVTDIAVENKKQCDLAIKYGMTPYYSTLMPAGPHPQEVSQKEKVYLDYITGKDLDPQMPRAERRKIINQRRVEKQYRYGGEKVAETDVLTVKIPCFISDTDFTYNQKMLDEVLDKKITPGMEGIFMDYFGYVNHHGCYCAGCLEKLQKFLSENNLPDTQSNRDTFYRNELVSYYNKVIDYIKSRRPDLKTVAHLYPDFHPEPLFGNRLKLDYCGQTVAWYFQWDNEKIDRYTRFVTEHAKDYHPNSEGLPFLGLNNSKKTPLGFKDPADLEREMRIILNAGGRTLMVCDGRVLLDPAYSEIFRKYCTSAK